MNRRAKAFGLTVNGQALTFVVEANCDVTQTNDYYKRGRNGAYGIIGVSSYGGYQSGRVVLASTRTIANMVEHFMKTQGYND